MVRIEAFYDAAGRSGLLVDAEIDGHTIAVDFRSPDETVLDGLALSTDYTIRFPASALPSLAAGDTVSIGGSNYRVRDIRSIGDGSERRASLSRL
ncbi:MULTISPECIES: head-tail joining protein [unclassified Cupriavidus]|uniref:head-tail joining protein n=1 Tax=unclassified Cupriavidus TaxID=2640874 RepID=UPI00064A5C16